MVHLIDKDALAEEIKKRIKYNHERAYLDRSPVMAGREREDEDILSLIDTFKVKEVDLEKEYERYYEQERNIHQTFRLAKHFFELGLNAQRK